MIPLFVPYDSKFNYKLMFSSKDMNWETPYWLFNFLNNIFHFNLDICATKYTAKCKNYYTPEIDALKQDWKGICWMNPPYGRSIGIWLKKAYEESIKHNSIIVCLIPSRTDTKYEHDIVFKYSKAICFIRGRLKFGNSNNAAPFPSQIVTFGNISEFKINLLNEIGFTIINHNFKE